MRTIIRSVIFTLALIMPATAIAVDFESIDTVADCNGWRSDLQVSFRSGAQMVRLEYLVVLTDADGAEVQRFEHEAPLVVAPGSTVALGFDGTWDSEPTDGWDVAADFTLIDIVPDLVNFIHGNSATTVDCPATDDGDQQDELACTYPLGWWRRNPDAYPVSELEIGGAVLDERQIFRILRRRAIGQPLVLLAQVTIVAKFNSLLVPDNDMGPAIAAADGYLRDHPPFPQRRRDRVTPRERWRMLNEVRSLAAPLIRFNWPGCLGETAAAAGATGSVSTEVEAFTKAMEAEPAETATSFGTLKAMYR